MVVSNCRGDGVLVGWTSARLDAIAATACWWSSDPHFRAGAASWAELEDFISHIIVTTGTSAHRSTAVQQESVRTAGRWNFQRSATPRGSHEENRPSAAAAARCRWTRGATVLMTAPAARARW